MTKVNKIEKATASQNRRYLKRGLVRITTRQWVEGRRNESAANKATHEIATRNAIGEPFVTKQFAVSDRQGDRRMSIKNPVLGALFAASEVI